ncbi:nucleopolyhedrovirus P10 family protein [Streptomyces sp. NPDC046831]|uniref:nucleopolyhedrovirus P10 family protein n=1 Tax=Streptomyces sp. NPDC046831 TaxID=3154805 RepID=UPI0033DF671C
MTADRWTRTVRRQLALGRLLPLGGPGDGAWIAESAAAAVLRRAAEDVPGVRLGELRIAPAGPEESSAPVVPPPPSALPPGPLRVSAELSATAAEPLPVAAARLREVLASAATGALGLAVTDVDLRVTALLDSPAGGGERAPARVSRPPEAVQGADAEANRVAAAVLAVPGVARLTGVLGGPGRAVHVEVRREGTGAALPRRHVRVEVALRADHRALDVALEVRAVAAAALPDRPTVAVLVTDVG